MPNRIIREGILTSERVAALDWASEVFYRRLHSIVDDYGRHEAGHQLLRAKCYPLQTDSVRVADIARWMAACHDSGLILVYGANGKQYLEVCDFNQRTRTDSKYPAPPSSANTCPQMPANARLGVCVVGGVCEDVVEQVAPPSATPAADPKPKAKNGSRLPEGWTLPPEWAAWARAKRPDLNIQEQGEKFADFFHAAPGVKGRKTDWQATWRNWIRNERQGQASPVQPSGVPRGKPQGPSETPLERAVAWARQQHAYGAIDVAERDRLIAEATAKHREAA